jgi:hypothetical protein
MRFTDGSGSWGIILRGPIRHRFPARPSARHPAADDPDDWSDRDDAAEVCAPPIMGRAGLADRGSIPVRCQRYVSRANGKNLSIPWPHFPFGSPAPDPMAHRSLACESFWGGRAAMRL